ncbi:MAG: hypothetical protein AAF789_06330 [Bacteroidota bacterium]
MKNLAMLFLAVLLFYSCEETETTTIDITGTAIITGTVLADTEQVNTPFESEALDSVGVRIIWNTNALGVVSDGDGRNQTLVVFTNANGVYSAEVPSTDVGVSFSVEFDELSTDVTYSNGLSSVTTAVIFPSTTYNSVTVRSGESITQDHDYGSSPQQTLEEFGTISGNVVADLEQVRTDGLPEAANGVNVTLEWRDGDNNDRSLATTTDANGDYSFQAPTSNINGSFTVVFEEFTASVEYNDGFRDVTGFSATFSETSYTGISVSKGSATTRNHNYGSNPQDALPVFAVIEGTVEARVNAIPGEVEQDPVANLEIRVSWTDGDGVERGAFTTTDAQGEYRVEVPIQNDDDINVRFTEFTVNYDYNNGAQDIRGATATYNEVNTTSFNLSKGEERTFNQSYFFPSSIED